MRQDRPRSRAQAEGNFSPAGELGYGREGHGQINRVTKVGNGDGGPKLDRQACYDRRRACQYAAIFQVVVGPNLAEAESSQRLPCVFGKPDQFRERVTIENMKGIVYADFAGVLFCVDGHTAAAMTAL